MPTNKQRRDAARRHLERQLQRREERAARHRKVTLIASIAGTLVLVAAIIVVVAIANSGSSTPKSQAGADKSAPSASTTGATPSLSPSAATAPVVAPSACTAPAKNPSTTASVTFDGVTLKNAYDLSTTPTIVSHVSAAPTSLECMDLAIGKGTAATPTSSVSVHYVGALLKNGTVFDGPKTHGAKPIPFSLTGVVAGFTQGIGGTGKVAPMKIGGRRLLILPSSLGYGATASGPIPANSALIFVVDLVTAT